MAMGQMRRTATAKSYLEEKNFRCILNNGVASPDLRPHRSRSAAVGLHPPRHPAWIPSPPPRWI